MICKRDADHLYGTVWRFLETPGHEFFGAVFGVTVEDGTNPLLDDYQRWLRVHRGLSEPDGRPPSLHPPQALA